MQHCQVGIKEHFHGGVASHHFLAIGVVEAAAGDTQKHQHVSRPVVFPEVHVPEIGRGAEDDPEEGQSEAQPAGGGHPFTQNDGCKNRHGDGGSESDQGRVAGQRHPRAPGCPHLSRENSQDSHQKISQDIPLSSLVGLGVVPPFASDQRVEHDGGQGHRTPHREKRAHLVLHQLDAGELKSPHQIATKQEKPRPHRTHSVRCLGICITRPNYA